MAIVTPDNSTLTQAEVIERWLKIWHPLPGEVIELRALHVPDRAQAICHIYASPEELAQAAVQLDRAGAKGCYFSLNPLLPSLLGRKTSAHKEDVLARHWLPIDVDPLREAGSNANQLEREAAWQVLLQCRQFLDAAGLAQPVIGDSGNGFHICYPLQLPNDQAAHELLRFTISYLAGLHNSSGAIIDTATFDAPRIWRLYGTRARKGPHSPERPHRWTKLIEGLAWDNLIAQANTRILQDLVFRWQSAAELRRLHASASVAGTPYARAALQQELNALSNAPVGARNNQLNRSAFALGQLIGTHALDRQEVEAALTLLARSLGLPDTEAHNTIQSGLNSGIAQPRTIPSHQDPLTNGASHTTQPPLPADLVIRASDVVPCTVEWLWPGRIPLGKLTTFAGLGGLGKTFALCDIAARVSAGLPWPDDPQLENPAGQVVFISAEDDPEDTLVPRLNALQANLHRILFLKTQVLDHFSLKDLPVLDRILQQAGACVRLVAIDPPTAFLGNIDDHKNSSLRALLGPLKNWAYQHQCSVIFNTHLNKAAAVKGEALMRVMGSVAWVNAVRAAYLFVRDPENHMRRLFLGLKMNLALEPPGLAFHIVDSLDGGARLEWLGSVKHTADDVLANSTSRPRTQQATTWLAERLHERAEWPSSELFAAATAAKISRTALYEAKRLLNLPGARKIVTPQGTSWIWWVPDNWTPPSL